MPLTEDNVGALLHWSYANLAMAHAAVTQGATAYSAGHYAIRSKFNAGLRSGSINVRPLADDERLKLVLPQACAYCGAGKPLAADHIVPRHRGGEDVGDNLIWACRSCNSSKATTDLLAWYERRALFPPLLLLRRYLKLALQLCEARSLMNVPVETVAALDPGLEMEVWRAPKKFPPPAALKMWVVW